MSYPLIGIYSGNASYYGVSRESVEALEQGIRAIEPSFQMIKTGRSHWQKVDILIFPGGKCSEWNEILSNSVQRQIDEWFQKGKRILGICAGAYFCSARSQYQSFPLRERIISPFSGLCKGPLFPERLRIVEIRWESTQATGFVVNIDGPTFEPNDEDQSVEVLATYCETPVEGKPAVIQCRKGNGLAILSAVHLEYSDISGIRPLYDESHWEMMHSKVTASSEFRKECMRRILAILNTPLTE